MAAPYPASVHLINPVWDSLASVQQLAAGSDIWPMTWAADGSQYTAYGDGWGFNVAEPSKLSMGFAVVDNGPTGLTESDPGGGGDCQNINTSTGETTGEGSSGKKPSGIIAIGSYLWLWVRNADQAGGDVELWYSSDNGVNWTDCGWDMALSTMSFVNAGQGSANVIDGYVYAVCANGSDAYTAYDSMALLRCAVTGNGSEMATLANWEYFSGTAASPAWSSDFADRAPVFSYSGGCYRQQMSYIPAVGRYIWWILHEAISGSHNDAEWGIYESPNPYGPWKTVAHYESGSYWDDYPGETGGFPVKWMSLSGSTLTMYLVSSTDDAFSVRGLTLTYSAIGSGTSALSLVGANSNSATSGTAVSVTHGLSINEGDLVLAVVHANSDTNSISDNNGSYPFTQRDQRSYTSATRAVFWRIAGSSEPSSYNWTLSASARWCVVVFVYRPATGESIQTDPFDIDPTSLNSGYDSTIQTNGITIGVDDATVIGVGYIDSVNFAFPDGPDDGFVMVEEVGIDQPVSVYHKARSAGAQAAVDWGSVGTYWAAELFSLKPSAGNMYYQSVAGDMPSATGNLASNVIFRESIAGDMPAAQGVLLKKIMKGIAGSCPASSGALALRISKQLSGDVPGPSGVLIKRTGKGLSGDMPAASGGILTAVVSLAKTVLGVLPAPAGGVVKKIGKSVSGVMPSAGGETIKRISKMVTGSMPAADGSLQNSWKTSESVSGSMPAPSGVISTVLNPIVTATAKMVKIIGSGFKKLIG